MKKFAVLLLMSFSVFAAPKDQLSQRLQKNAGFSADFAQQVISPEGDVVMQGKGSVEIARPSLFRWTTSVPDDTLLVSDGKSVWYYSPFVDQVTIYWQKQATAQTPFILLTRNRASDWDNYRVEQQGDTFTLTPTAADSNQGQFKIIINSKGAVQGFSVIEQDGQQSKFVFSHIDLTKPSAERFKFVVPDGVEVDDQRN